MKKPLLKQPSEHQLQVALIEYLAYAARPEIYYFAIPNGGLRNVRVAMKLRNEGTRRGSPDLCFLLPRGRVGWMELKTRKGALSPEQKHFQAKCAELGHWHRVIRNHTEAVGALTEWGVLRPQYEPWT